jgi:hypothetical protein
VYDGGYLGLAPDTNLERVFVRLEGTMDHVINMTLIDGGALQLHLTGSTNNRARLNYHINGTTVVKAKSYINCSNPRAHEDQYQLVFNILQVEGGGAINGSFMKMQATDFTVDDGGIVSVNNGGHDPNMGQGKILKRLFFCCTMFYIGWIFQEPWNSYLPPVNSLQHECKQIYLQ